MSFVALLIKMKLLPKLESRKAVTKRREGSRDSVGESTVPAKKHPNQNSNSNIVTGGQNALEDEYIVRHILRCALVAKSRRWQPPMSEPSRDIDPRGEYMALEESNNRFAAIDT